MRLPKVCLLTLLLAVSAKAETVHSRESTTALNYRPIATFHDRMQSFFNRGRATTIAEFKKIIAFNGQSEFQGKALLTDLTCSRSIAPDRVQYSKGMFVRDTPDRFTNTFYKGVDFNFNEFRSFQDSPAKVQALFQKSTRHWNSPPNSYYPTYGKWFIDRTLDSSKSTASWGTEEYRDGENSLTQSLRVAGDNLEEKSVRTIRIVEEAGRWIPVIEMKNYVLQDGAYPQREATLETTYCYVSGL